MIVRDEHGIIVQHPSMDGGDSSARMGISALETDENLGRFLVGGDLLVRHPYQLQWNDPDLTSRDQLVQFCVSNDPPTGRAANAYKDKWFINKDFLEPAVRLYLYKCAKRKPPLWLSALGQANLWASLLFNTRIKPFEEMNQFACVMIKLGSDWRKRFVSMHPDVRKAVMDYWSGWRDQPEIGEILMRALTR